MASEAILDISNIAKHYNGFKAIDALSFSVRPGLIYGLLGPNGAGKTTTIRMIMKIILPDAGRIEIFGEPLEKVNKARVGYLPEERGLYKKMKVLDLLVFFGEIKQMKKETARKTAAEWLERMQLGDYMQKKAEDLSKGMQQKVQFISTVLHSPELIILDEPFTGLDPVNTNILKDIILEMRRKGHTIIFSTHMMEQVEKLCDSICLINKGGKVLDGSLSDIKKQYGRNGVTLRFSGDGSFIGGLPEVESVNDYGKELFLRLKEGADAGNVLKEAAKRLEILKYEVAEPSIHDIFIEQVSSK
jgi:ABC-2 type transport system ATP-binding protein